MQGKKFSWPQFVIGVLLGTGAMALLLVSVSNVYASVLLLFLSAALMIQAPESVGTQERTIPAETAGSKWRQLARAGLQILLAVIVFFVVSSAWDRALRRFPSLADIPLDIIAVLIFATVWLVGIVRAYRDGRSRRLADHQ